MEETEYDKQLNEARFRINELTGQLLLDGLAHHAIAEALNDLAVDWDNALGDIDD